MGYLILARKYRPQNFDEVVGQEYITKILKNAIVFKKIAPAYLFCGPRGIGKTTTARILAKSLNCRTREENKPEPCNECSSCKEITSSSSIDVLEIDAASHTGVDNVRDVIIENIGLSTVRDKYKIFIIDEVHMLSQGAFNALLKTLEEPPAHVVFILATTEPQKIPATVLSRCQKFNFHMPPLEKTIGHLNSLAQKENIKIDNQSLVLISKAAGGSLRDAISMLDQFVSLTTDKITAEDVTSILGIIPHEVLVKLTDYVMKHDAKGLLNFSNEILLSSYAPQTLIKDLREHFRNILLAKVSPELLEPQHLPDNAINETNRQAKEFPTDAILRNIRVLSQCLDSMRWSDDIRLIFEVFLVKLASHYISADSLLEKLDGFKPKEETQETLPLPEETKTETAKTDTATTNPQVKMVLDLFDGEVVDENGKQD